MVGAVDVRQLMQEDVEQFNRMIGYVRAEQDAVLAVEDEGPGIDESKCGELSKAFVRMDSRFGGIGLGLSIVSRITQLHQGHFYLQNRQGANGTRAWVELAKIQ